MLGAMFSVLSFTACADDTALSEPETPGAVVENPGTVVESPDTVVETPSEPADPEENRTTGSEETQPSESENAPKPTETKPSAKPAEDPKPEFTALNVLVNGLNVRSKATASSASLGSVDKGVYLLCLGEENGFYKTLYCGKTAYVSAKYVKLFTMKQSESLSVEAIIAEGCKWIGTPYVYGAVRYMDSNGNKLKNFTTNAFDCSSLMQYIFYIAASVRLQVTTRTQVTQGIKVGKDSLKRGDLMFFTNASRYSLKGIERVGHVALYLGGNLILHTASDYCKIEPISDLRWSYFLEARRMV